jgi:hypothetical protein
MIAIVRRGRPPLPTVVLRRHRLTGEGARLQQEQCLAKIIFGISHR